MMQWKVVIAVVLLGAVFALGWYSGSLSGRLTASNRSADLALDQLDKVLAEQDQDRKDRKKLQDTLDKLPKVERKHADAVRNNPAGCDRPAPVANSLQDGIDSANSSRALPRNP